MKPWNEELVKSVIGSTIENILFETEEDARDKLDRSIGYLIKNAYISDGQACIKSGKFDIYTITIQVKDINKKVFTYVYKISPNKIEEVKPFDLTIIQEPLDQMVHSCRCLLVAYESGVYKDIAEFNNELRSLDHLFTKLKIATKYE